MSYRWIVDKVTRYAGLDDQAAARSLIDDVLELLGHVLSPSASHRLAEQLPGELQWPLLALSQTWAIPADSVFRSLARRRKLSLGLAVEHAEVVCRAVASSVDDATVEAVRAELPKEMRRSFVPLEEAPPLEQRLHYRGDGSRRQTIADGRPGGSEPLSEAGPGPGAHSQSVVRSDDPYSSRLSSSHGLISGREGQTLADGKPGSEHPLARR